MNEIDLLISGILALIMLSVGLTLSSKDFINTFTQPRPFWLGLFLQIVFLPIFAGVLVYYSGLPVPFQMGIMILALCPGGTTSNMISYLFSANTALSIALTVANSLLVLVTIPLMTNYVLVPVFMDTSAQISLPFWDTIVQIFAITIVPVFFGMLIRKQNSQLAIRLEAVLKWATIGLLGLLFGIKLFASETQGGAGLSMNELFSILPFSVLINIGALAVGYFLSRWFKFERNTSLTIGVELGIQNTSLGFLITATLLGDNEMVKPILVYGMFTFFTAIFFGLIVGDAKHRKGLASFIRGISLPR